MQEAPERYVIFSLITIPRMGIQRLLIFSIVYKYCNHILNWRTGWWILNCSRFHLIVQGETLPNRLFYFKFFSFEIGSLLCCLFSPSFYQSLTLPFLANFCLVFYIAFSFMVVIPSHCPWYNFSFLLSKLCKTYKKVWPSNNVS